MTRRELTKPAFLAPLGCLLLLALAATAATAQDPLAATLGYGNQPIEAPSDPLLVAKGRYESGQRSLDKARELEQQAAAESNDKKRLKLETKARRQYTKSIGAFEVATANAPGYYQAWSALGVALARIGDDAGSRNAYGQVLTIPANSPEALGHRGRAALALGRIATARQVHASLARVSTSESEELMVEIKAWALERRTSPDGFDAAALDELDAWIEGRS